MHSTHLNDDQIARMAIYLNVGFDRIKKWIVKHRERLNNVKLDRPMRYFDISFPDTTTWTDMSELGKFQIETDNAELDE